ncbi:CoA transferase [Comamonadaceae bacterium G21597-S1]|nr:CoA transferase [Comamonadaceae bacterium G21597-S1]
MNTTSRTRHGTLSDLRVIDLTRVYAGPACTQMLADHGADVIKIEPPQGDETRDWGTAGPQGLSSYFWGLNRNKRTLALDFGQAAGREVLLRLLQDADVLIDNFKLGTLERWGLGYANDLQPRFPRLVHLTISGFGTRGPLAGYPGYDAVAQAFAGVMSVNGEPGGEPLKLPMPVVDYATGLYATSALLMALHERQRSGCGQHIDLSLFDVALTMTHPLSTTWMFTEEVPAPTGNVYAAIAPYGLFSCRDRKVFTGAGNNGAFRKLCRVLGMPELADDSRFADNRQRVAHRAALDAALSAATRQWDGEELALTLMRAGVAAGVVQNLHEAFHHPQAVANGMWQDLGGGKVVANPIRLDRTPATLHSPAPTFGRDTDDVLAEAGYSAGQIADLEQAGALARQRKAAHGAPT